jgi:hypothetical protein
LSIKPLYKFDDERRQHIVKMHLEMPRGGAVAGPTEGAHGEIYSILLIDSGRTRPTYGRGAKEYRKSGIENPLGGSGQPRPTSLGSWENDRLPARMWDLVFEALSVDPIARPLTQAFEDRLSDALRLLDSETHAGLRIAD